MADNGDELSFGSDENVTRSIVVICWSHNPVNILKAIECICCTQ